MCTAAQWFIKVSGLKRRWWISGLNNESVQSYEYLVCVHQTIVAQMPSAKAEVIHHMQRNAVYVLSVMLFMLQSARRRIKQLDKAGR